jgi:hypothetical protein
VTGSAYKMVLVLTDIYEWRDAEEARKQSETGVRGCMRCGK